MCWRLSAAKELLSAELDYQDVKLKIVQQEGYDAHDFNLFDDRSSQLWRKPYVDGAVRELTAGSDRSEEQIRQAVEQMMLAAGTPNPDVRHTRRKGFRARGNVHVHVEIDDETQLLRDDEDDRPGLSPAGTHKISRPRERVSPARLARTGLVRGRPACIAAAAGARSVLRRAGGDFWGKRRHLGRGCWHGGVVGGEGCRVGEELGSLLAMLRPIANRLALASGAALPGALKTRPFPK